MQILEAKVTDEISTRLDSFLAIQFHNYFSRSQVQKNIRQGLVKVNQKIIQKPSFLLQKNDQVEVHYTSSKSFQLKPCDLQVPILYQDEYLAIVHKPAGMTVHPGAGTQEDTLVHSLLAQMDSLSSSEDFYERPGIVHRLDRDTEGLLIVAKKNHAHFKLADLFAKHNIEKKYIAWVCGFPKVKEQRIEGYMQRHPSSDSVLRKKMLFSLEPIALNAKFSALSFMVQKEVFPFALLSIHLETGRTHQIRATFQHLQHAVVNDSLYGNKKFFSLHHIKKPDELQLQASGMLLVANYLKFEHPYFKKTMEFQLPLPQRFLDFEEKVKEIL